MKSPTLIDKAFILKRMPPFASLDLDLLLSIANKLALVIFDSNDDIFVAGEDANRMYFIVSGQVHIRGESLEILCELNPGDFFGEEALFNNKPRSYAASVPMETQILTLSRSNLYSILSECPSVAIGFLQLYATALPFRSLKRTGLDA